MSGSRFCIPRNETVGAASLFPKQNYNVQFLHSYICERFIYFQDRSVYFAAAKYVDRSSWEYINRSQTHECGNWDWGRAMTRQGIHKWDFRCSAGTLHALCLCKDILRRVVLASGGLCALCGIFILTLPIPIGRRRPTTRPLANIQNINWHCNLRWCFLERVLHIYNKSHILCLIQVCGGASIPRNRESYSS